MNPSPGPWSWDAEQHSLNVLRASNGVSVAMLDVRVTPEGAAAEVSDRALIALAPEMREMLLKLEWQHDEDMTFCCVCYAARRDGSRSKKPLVHEADCALAALLEKLR